MKKLISIFCVIFSLINLCACQKKKIDIDNDISFSKEIQSTTNKMNYVGTWIDNSCVYDNEGNFLTSEYVLEILDISEQTIKFSFWNYRIYSIGDNGEPVIGKSIGNNTYEFNYGDSYVENILSGKIKLYDSKIVLSIDDSNFEYWSDLKNSSIEFFREGEAEDEESTSMPYDSSEESDLYITDNRKHITITNYLENVKSSLLECNMSVENIEWPDNSVSFDIYYQGKNYGHVIALSPLTGAESGYVTGVLVRYTAGLVVADVAAVNALAGIMSSFSVAPYIYCDSSSETNWKEKSDKISEIIEKKFQSQDGDTIAVGAGGYYVTMTINKIRCVYGFMNDYTAVFACGDQYDYFYSLLSDKLSDNGISN